MPPAISIQNLSKVYATGVKALDNISFDIQSGDFFGLLGPNGAGKSTLINILAGPVKKTAGRAEIFGIDIAEDTEEAKMLIGIVPQEVSFDPFFTVNELLTFQSGYYRIKNNQKKIDQIIEKLALQDKKHTKTRALSGGMRRRLLIAKALVHNPKVIVLDEPTAGVDVELRHLLWKYIRELNQEGITILLTTHYLEEAESLCKNIAVINHGRLIALNTTENLKTQTGKKSLEEVYLHLTS